VFLLARGYLKKVSAYKAKLFLKFINVNIGNGANLHSTEILMKGEKRESCFYWMLRIVSVLLLVLAIILWLIRPA